MTITRTTGGVSRMAPKTITLPCYGIVVNLTDYDPKAPDHWLGGAIASDLHEASPHALVQLAEDEADRENRFCYDAGIDALESMILGHACAGIDIESPAYLEGIETAVNALAANFS